MTDADLIRVAQRIANEDDVRVTGKPWKRKPKLSPAEILARAGLDRSTMRERFPGASLLRLDGDTDAVRFAAMRDEGAASREAERAGRLSARRGRG